MFQKYDVSNTKALGPSRVAMLREELGQRGLDGFLIPRADAHQGEYVPPNDCRLEWITGFSGSAGAACVLRDEAAIFVDGRYTIQVREQVDGDCFEYRHLHNEPVTDYICTKLTKGMKLGFDPMLHTVQEVRGLQEACTKVGAELVGVETNPIDAVWADRPAAPCGAVQLHPIEYAGEAAADKIARMQAAIADKGADTALLTQPDSVAWLFNIRGSDVSHTPLPLSFALLNSTGKPDLFIDGRKLSGPVREALAELAELHEMEALVACLRQCGATRKTVMIDCGLAGQALYDAVALNGGSVLEGEEPTLLPKAIKNPREIAGAKAAHVRDGVAFVKFLNWFAGNVPRGGHSEVSIAQKLEQFRAETGVLKDISFDSISGFGPHGAICHYRVSHDSDLAVEAGNLYLIDSGAQYEDGTTDITRTLAVGDVSETHKKHFTLVLKGHIALACARFPVGTNGAQLDTLARYALWQAGLDFDHGTGHGVGSYLSVHEGPQRIAKNNSRVALEPGMILSNEPGYYRAGEYGIRIENLELVTEPREIAGGDLAMLGFEPLTLAPIDLALVDVAMLTEAERAWLNTYHGKVAKALAPYLEGVELAFLQHATRTV